MTISEQTPDGTKHKGLAIPLRSIRGQHVAVDATVNQVKMQLMIDTGDTGSMTLSTADWQRVFPSGSAKVHTIIEGGPWGKPMSVSAARIEKVEIASNHYRDLVATLAKNPAAPSTLGLKFLRRHIVTFDFANQTLFLEPSSLFTEIESADMSGLHIIRLGDDTVIYAVDEESPAAQAKLAAGDIIESINGKESGTLTLWEIRRALKIRDGEPVTVKIKRGDEEGLYHFVLRSSL
jgi:membrane-associated protease RseP (regulator of RpoE activity)